MELSGSGLLPTLAMAQKNALPAQKRNLWSRSNFFFARVCAVGQQTAS